MGRRENEVLCKTMPNGSIRCFTNDKRKGGISEKQYCLADAEYFFTLTTSGNARIIDNDMHTRHKGLRAMVEKGLWQPCEGQYVDGYNRSTSNDTAGTLTTRTDAGNMQFVCVAIRGRNPQGGAYEQTLEVGSEEYTNTITTVEKDNMLMEKRCKEQVLMSGGTEREVAPTICCHYSKMAQGEIVSNFGTGEKQPVVRELVPINTTEGVSRTIVSQYPSMNAPQLSGDTKESGHQRTVVKELLHGCKDGTAGAIKATYNKIGHDNINREDGLKMQAVLERKPLNGVSECGKHTYDIARLFGEYHQPEGRT